MIVIYALAAVLILGLVYGPVVINGMKGKYGFMVVNLVFAFTYPAGWIAAVRLAKPDSWWARRFYDDAKMARAVDRVTPAVEPKADEFHECPECGELFESERDLSAHRKLHS